MKPSPEFLMMIAGQLKRRQSIITSGDLIAHSYKPFSFYSISYATFFDGRIVSQTEPFTDQIMIEIETAATRMIIGSLNSPKQYKKITEMQLGSHAGKSFVYWQVRDLSGVQYTAVKLIADDGMMQIKLISADNRTQTIHNVCLLPSIL